MMLMFIRRWPQGSSPTEKLSGIHVHLTTDDSRNLKVYCLLSNFNLSGLDRSALLFICCHFICSMYIFNWNFPSFFGKIRVILCVLALQSVRNVNDRPSLMITSCNFLFSTTIKTKNSTNLCVYFFLFMLT